MDATLNANASYKNSAKIGNKYFRPLYAQMNINSVNWGNFETYDETRLIDFRRTFFHETTHALAYSSSLYKDYIDENGNALKESDIVTRNVSIPGATKLYTVITHPKMQKLVADYFNCPTALGYILETNQNSHFHQQLIVDTIMRPIAEAYDDRVTSFILALFDMTGWYKVDYSKVEKTLAGKGKGCDYANLKCTDENGKMFQEYCDFNNRNYQCDFYGDYVSKCTSGPTDQTYLTYGNTCDYLRPSDNQNNKCAPMKKKCFNTSTGASCFASKCNKADRSITVTVGSSTATATYSASGPSVKSFKDGAKEYFFPESYERFCFVNENPIDLVSKGFKK